MLVPRLKAAQLLLVAELLVACGGGSKATTPQGADFVAWADAIPDKHPNLFFKLPRPDFEAMVESLASDEEELDATAFLARWQRIIRAIGDEHTSVPMPELSRNLPLVLSWYPDGIYVINADSANRDLVGSRVDSIDAKDVLELMGDLRPYVAYSVESYFRHRAANDLWSRFGLLQGAGLLPSGNQHLLRFTMADGAEVERSLDLTTTTPSSYVSPLLRDAQPDDYYFFRRLSNQGVVYLRYRLCDVMPTYPWAAFADDLMAALDEPTSTKVVIDLRGNPGGTTAPMQQLAADLTTSKYNAPGRVAVLVDGGTFSSAFLIALGAKELLQATLVGDTVGQALTNYGNQKTFALPSGRAALYSTRKYDFAPSGVADPFRAPLEPDVRVVETIDDLRAERDPVLDAALQM